jgi:heat shock protein HtpX
MAGARLLPECELPELHELVASLAARIGVPPPALYLIEEPSPNTFAVGRDPRHAAIALTTGLLELLDDAEGAAVIAHELSHVEHRETLIGGVFAALVFLVTLPLQLLLQGVQAIVDLVRGYSSGRDWADPQYGRRQLMFYLAPILSPLIHFVGPGRGEYLADARAAELTASPAVLASALRRLADAIPLGPPLEADPAMRHLFILNPVPESRLDWLVSARPPLAERLRRLGPVLERAA